MIANHCLAAQKLAQVPELLSMVCAFLGSSGCRTVACVSHRFFNAAAPIIWEEVEGVHNLLALFPGTEVIRTAIPGKRTNILRTVSVTPLPGINDPLIQIPSVSLQTPISRALISMPR